MKEILDRLEAFDKAHGWDRYNKVSGDKERVDALQNETLYLLGELGEFANELKKSRRDGVFKQEELKEEAIDMLFFYLKIAKLLDMDIEKEFHKKMDLNEKRFKHLEIK